MACGEQFQLRKPSRPDKFLYVKFPPRKWKYRQTLAWARISRSGQAHIFTLDPLSISMGEQKKLPSMIILLWESTSSCQLFESQIDKKEKDQGWYNEMKLIITPYETKINFLINHFTLYLVTY
jgi:hypothetical protein